MRQQFIFTHPCEGPVLVTCKSRLGLVKPAFIDQTSRNVVIIEFDDLEPGQPVFVNIEGCMVDDLGIHTRSLQSHVVMPEEHELPSCGCRHVHWSPATDMEMRMAARRGVALLREIRPVS